MTYDENELKNTIPRVVQPDQNLSADAPLYLVAIRGDVDRSYIVAEPQLKAEIHVAVCACPETWSDCRDSSAKQLAEALDDNDCWVGERFQWAEAFEDGEIIFTRITVAPLQCDSLRSVVQHLEAAAFHRGVGAAKEAVRSVGSPQWEGSEFKPFFINAIAGQCQYHASQKSGGEKCSCCGVRYCGECGPYMDSSKTQIDDPCRRCGKCINHCPHQ